MLINLFHKWRIIQVLMLLAILSGCKNLSETQEMKGEPIINMNSSTNENGTIGNNLEEQAVLKNDNSVAQNYDFFGVWEFTNNLPGYIGGLSQTEIDSYLGKQVTLSQQLYQFEEEVLNNPHYKFEEMLTTDFVDGYKLSYEAWDIEEKYITMVEVLENDGSRWSGTFSGFYIIDSRIIVVIEGEFFELTRVSEGIENHESNIIDPETVEKGQLINGLTVVNVDKSGVDSEVQINDISFSGELTLSGMYEWGETGDGDGYVFTVDEAEIMLGKLPLLKDFQDENTLLITNSEEAKQILPLTSGRATLTFSNYSIGYRQIMISADLVGVVD